MVGWRLEGNQLNIFYLDHDPAICAKLHCDKHVVKMVLEYAQLLSTAHHVAGSWKKPMYRPTHVNHPSAVWVRASENNYNWLYCLFIATCEEYTHRYGKVHKTDSKLREALRAVPVSGQGQPFTQPAQAMPDACKRSCSIDAYRTYYREHKSDIATYKNREVPNFMSGNTAPNLLMRGAL